jgi:hypothetical protein
MLQQMSDIQPVAQSSPRNLCWLRAAAQTNGAGAASWDAEKKAKYGAGEQFSALAYRKVWEDGVASTKVPSVLAIGYSRGFLLQL